MEAYIFDKIIVHGILKRKVLKTFQVVAIIVQFRIRASKNVSNNFEYPLSWCYMIHLYFARATMQLQSISIILFNDFYLHLIVESGFDFISMGLVLFCTLLFLAFCSSDGWDRTAQLTSLRFALKSGRRHCLRLRSLSLLLSVSAACCFLTATTALWRAS